MLKSVLLLLAVFFSGSHQQCFSRNDAVASPTLKAYNAWVASAQNFSLTLLRSLSANPDISNVIFSPSGVREALLLAYFGAAHETEASLAKVLQIPRFQTKPLTWKIYNSEKLMNLGRATSNYPLRSANKIFISSKLNLRRCMKDKFEKQLESIRADADVEWTQNHINQFVKLETNGKITDFFKYLNSYTKSTLVNAVSFKAKWMRKFDANNSQTLNFNSNSSPTVTFMIKDDNFEYGYSKELGARLLLLPHEGNRTGMIVVLPDNALRNLINKLNDRTFGYVVNRQNYKSSYRRVYIPKIEKRSNVYLDTILEKLGVGNALTANADFSGFTGKKDVFITEVVHQALIEVDEYGSNVLDASGIATERSGFSVGEPFICDHPFAYIMYDFLARKVLLMGTYFNDDIE